MEIKMIKPTDVDYPLAMNLVPFAEKYDLMKIDNLVVVPLFQVIDAISEVKADIVVHDGVECCPTCMKPIKGTFTKSDMVAMLTELQTEIEELDLKDSFLDYQRGAEETREYIANLIQQKIDSLKMN
jgi:hypothetical protein